MIISNEEFTTGELESVEVAEGQKERELKDGTKTKKFVKFRVGGHTYNFFDYQWYVEHPEIFRAGNIVNVVWMPSEYEVNGQKRTSRIAKAVTFGKNADITEQTATEQKDTNWEIMKTDMTNAWVEAHTVAEKLKKAGIELNNEDIRSTAMSLFIQLQKK